MRMSHCASASQALAKTIAFSRIRLQTGIVFLFLLFPHYPLQAQITSDRTMSVNSRITHDGNIFLIDGGTPAGNNLFHSFSEFSIPTGSQAFFNNSPTIKNIISRVTGGSISSINGSIQANGSANLFLINPKGIIFGPNASLDIGGSFLASTANGIRFADGTEFSAIAPQTTPLLTISVPVGLQFGANPGALYMQGKGSSISFKDPLFSPIMGAGSNLTGLRVQPGNTLALVGGDVALEGGNLTAPNGRIELGSVAEGLVNLSLTSQGFTLGYQNVPSFHDIRLSQRASVDASGSGGGSIYVRGARVTLTDGSVFLIQNQGSVAVGSISVNASDALQVIGTSPDVSITSGLYNQTLESGNGGDIKISTQRLVVKDGGSIQARTFGPGAGGNVSVSASKSVQVLGSSPLNPVASSQIVASTLSSGNAGDIEVSTGQLTVMDGGTVISATTFGTGFGGNVSVNAQESVAVIGADPRLLSASLVSSSTLGNKAAGNLTINTPRLVIRDGGRVDSSTLASGAAGNVTVNAPDSVEVSGKLPGSVNPSLIISSANTVDSVIQKLVGLPPVPSGTSGDVQINTNRLSVTDGAQVTVRNDGTGHAGTMRISAGSIFLDNQGGLTGSTASGEGGNISLQAHDLRLRHNSSITTTAGGSGNGGNITLNIDTLVALENSLLTANAFKGRGGNIRITAQGLFRSPDSEIKASSELGTNGTVQINTLVNNPSQGLVTLPVKPVDVTGQIAQGCPVGVGPRASKFVVTGRGGLPPDPTEALRSEPTLADLGTTVQSQESRTSATTSSNPTSSEPAPLVEAQGWVINAKGEVVLVAQAPTGTLHIPWLTPTTCQAIKTTS